MATDATGDTASFVPRNQANTAGRTALHELLLSGQCSADAAGSVQLLIGNSADVNTPTADGRLPLAIAGDKGCTQIVALLEKAGAKAN